jgi:hypothetical protein
VSQGSGSKGEKQQTAYRFAHRCTSKYQMEPVMIAGKI